ncbi:hypothetical protein ACJQWK_00578 [Exserohilum turcicum]
MISNAVLLSAFAACALAAPATSPNPSSHVFGPTNLWKVPAMANPKDPKHVLWKHVNLVESTVDVAAKDGRLFSYYPAMYNAGGFLYLLFSGASKDVDGMGQDVRISFLTQKGQWSKPEIAFPAALLPNQTTVQTSDYYCKRGISQRALQALTIVYVGLDRSDSRYYAVAQSSDNICPGSFQSAGRIARRINTDGNPSTGTFIGEPCWIETNKYTTSHEWAKTIYGTKYQMKVCKDKDAINAALAKPQNVPAQATSLLNAPLFAADKKHNVNYPTNAVYLTDSSSKGRYMRFWTDVSLKNRTGTAFVEYSADKYGKHWFPATTDGLNIQETNIYTTEKTWFGSSDAQQQTRVYISNGYMDPVSSQNILTIATSRGADLVFHNIGILRGGNASKSVPSGTRGRGFTDAPGFYWPSASFAGDELLVAYSENKAAIRVATIKLKDLP